MTSAGAHARPGRALGLVLAALALVVLTIIAIRALDRDLEPAEATVGSTSTANEGPRLVQAPAAPLERDAVETTAPEEQSAASPAPGISSSATSAEVIVWGYVRDRDGQPIESASMSFIDSLGERRFAEVAADGSYSMPGLEPGRWFVRAAAQGFLDGESLIDVPAERARVQRDFTLEPRPSLIVRAVTPDGRAFHEADVDPVSRKPRRTTFVAIATTERPKQTFIRFNHNGRYGAGESRFNLLQMARGEDGTIAVLDLFAPLPLFVSLLLGEEVIATQEVAGGSTAVVFVLDPEEVNARFGELRLTFVDAESRSPITPAMITVAHAGTTLYPNGLDPDGRIVLRRCEPGVYEVRTGIEGFASSNVVIELHVGEVVERTIELGRGVEVSGRCVDEHDRPVPGQFEISPLPRPGELAWHLEEDGERFFVATKDDGAIELRMELGVWLLQPQTRTKPGDDSKVPRLGANLVLDTRSGPVANLVVRLLPASHVVVNWSGPGRDEVRLWFVDEAGIVRGTEQFWSSAPRRCALPPGLWQVRVLDPNGVVREERSFTLGTEPVVLELGLSR